MMEEQQLEAMILRNFLLVQADKHGHQLLAALPTIAATAAATAIEAEGEEEEEETHQLHTTPSPLHFRTPIKPESEGDSSNDENYLLSSSSATACRGVSPPPQLSPPALAAAQHLLLQHQMARVAFGRLAATSNGVSVIQKVGKVAGTLPYHRPSPPSPAAAAPPFLPTVVVASSLKQEMSDPLKVEERDDEKEDEERRMIAALVPVNRHPSKSNREHGDSLLCQVCGERAGKHSYYGGQVCPSCRAFFRRSVQSRCNLNFRCINRSQSCHITLLTRKNCQFCRYQKCLESGMRPSWILSEEERIRRFHGRGRNAPAGGGGKCDAAGSEHEDATIVATKTASAGGLLAVTNLICPAPIGPPSAAESNLQLGAAERLQILQYGEVVRRCCSGRHDDLEPALLQVLVQSGQPGGGLPRSAAERLSTIIDTRTRVCFTLFQEFQSLSQSDQTAILRKNLPLVHRLRQAVCLAAHNLSWRRVVCMLVGEEKVVEAERQLPCDLSKKGAAGTDSGKLEYAQVFAAQGCCPPAMPRLLALVNQIKQLLSLNDPVILVLISLITAFSPDFLDLENREQVESVQLKFVLLLQQHVCPAGRGGGGPTAGAELRPAADQTTSSSSSELVRLLMVPSILRQMVELTRDMLLI